MNEFSEISKTCNLKMPYGFPAKSYDSIYELLQSKCSSGRNLGKYTDGFLPAQLTSSWISVAYKFRASFEYSQEYIEVTKPFKYTPTAIAGNSEALYAQERALFNFIVNSFSMIDSLYYCLHFIGALIDPTIFKYDAEDDNVQMKIKQKVTLDIYAQYHQSDKALETEALFSELKNLSTSAQYKELKKIRNQPAHRASPPIQVNWIIAGSGVLDGIPTSGTRWLNNISLDMEFTATRFEWLTQVLNNIMVVIQGFVQSKF